MLKDKGNKVVESKNELVKVPNIENDIKNIDMILNGLDEEMYLSMKE